MLYKNNIREYEVVAELMLGVSYLTNKKISSLFTINDINNYLFIADCLLNVGDECFIADYFKSNNYDLEFSKEEIEKSYEFVIDKLNLIFGKIKNDLDGMVYITTERFINIIEKQLLC